MVEAFKYDKKKQIIEHINYNDLRGQRIETSLILVSDINNFDEGRDFVWDIAHLLTFATQSIITCFAYKFCHQESSHGLGGFFNNLNPPLDANSQGQIVNFIIAVWENYQNYKISRSLGPLFEMISWSTMPGLPLEMKLISSVIALESIKNYFAISEMNRLELVENNNGSFQTYGGKKMGFGDLLLLAFEDVGMPKPDNFEFLKNIRNTIIHRGFFRPRDRLTEKLFKLDQGQNQLHGHLYSAIEQFQDAIREYIIKLLGYTGTWYRFSGRGETRGDVH